MSKSDYTHYQKEAGEGGCGVIGLASSVKIKGKHLLPGLCQMDNRGNGKGGGIAAVGLPPDYFGVSQETLNNDYLLAIGYLDETCRSEVERSHIHTIFDIRHVFEIPELENGQSILKLEVRPPKAVVYFVRVKQDKVAEYRKEKQLEHASQDSVEDDIIYHNSYDLNKSHYASSGEKRAFVFSNAKNLLVLKMVAYADEVIRYYKLEELAAHLWIGHHRYPTKGKIWHPGGAHPFVGLNEALVHNGDFANYFSISEYLAQRNIKPLFLTDTEVAALLFDLLYRQYGYPIEYVIEALAPTTERDFKRLPLDKQEIYKLIQTTHVQGSPDGPWFFLVVQSLFEKQHPAYRLLGITDTSMLRPQVFALQKGEESIGFSASEKQAIDATLQSISNEDKRFWPNADYYWNARGGSYTDGGAFIFTVTPQHDGKAILTCTDKFGCPIHEKELKAPYNRFKTNNREGKPTGRFHLPDLPPDDLYIWAKQNVLTRGYDELLKFLEALKNLAMSDHNRHMAFGVLTLLLDMHYPIPQMRRSSVISLVQEAFNTLAEKVKQHPTEFYTYADNEHQPNIAYSGKQTLILNAKGYKAEGEHSLALEIVRLRQHGFQKFMVINLHGQRFIGNGFGSMSHGIQIDVYGSSGDYLASGIDGADIYVHGNAQDQLAQIMKEGTLVVYGDVGQAFMYGAKGGSAYILGNAAGRPMINAVGKPRVIINGTCLDYLAESFMAGNPLEGGGFVILNGLYFDTNGELEELPTPYPGSNLFSLASGGAIYIRDPAGKVTPDLLNGGEFVPMTDADWQLIGPYLKKNSELFGISISRLLEYKGIRYEYDQIYRKIAPAKVRALQEEEAWVKGKT